MKTLLTAVAATALFASAMATAAPQPTPAEIKAELARFTEVAAAPVERYTTVSSSAHESNR